MLLLRSSYLPGWTLPGGSVQQGETPEVSARRELAEEIGLVTPNASLHLVGEVRGYALTDPIVLDALNAADRRGVAIRIVLDPRERHDFVKLGDLSDTVRVKRGGPFMHLKAYAIDGEELRTGSANFSTSGENAQDNDLIVIRDAGAAAKFDAHFERMWDAGEPMIEFEPAIRGRWSRGKKRASQRQRRPRD